MKALYILGGKQREARSLHALSNDWNGYDKGVIAHLCLDSGALTTQVEYISPPTVHATENPAITFQASSIHDGKLYTCTQTEVLVYSLPDFQLVDYLSLPCFNDIHHVKPTSEGTILVANAGLEMIIEVTFAGEIRRVWNVLGEDPWERFSKDIDYRKLSTKPHRSHPNYIFCIDDDIWVTRFHQGDALCLTNPEKHIHVSSERIHDGVVHNGLIYFTSVNGHIIVVNTHTLQIEADIDLNTMHDKDILIGWCRSILIDHDQIWVGFSRIRPTRLRENVSWVLRGFKRSLPSHIACYDLQRQQCVADIDLEPAGLAAIYTIFPA